MFTESKGEYSCLCKSLIAVLLVAVLGEIYRYFPRRKPFPLKTLGEFEMFCLSFRSHCTSSHL